MLPRNKLLLTDCVEGMKELPDDCIPLTVTSPPYDRVRIFDGKPFDFSAVAEQLWRVTAPGGVVVWVVDDQVVNGSESGTSARQKLAFLDLGFLLHETIYLFRSSSRQSQRHFGAVDEAYVLSKGKPRTVDARRVPCKSAGQRKDVTHRSPDGSRDRRCFFIVGDTRRRSVVWNCATGRHVAEEDFIRQAKHGALMPEQIARDLILTFSKSGDLCFDPMAGLATTCKMALLNHRAYLGMERVPQYIELAQRRLELAHCHYLGKCRSRLRAVS